MKNIGENVQRCISGIHMNRRRKTRKISVRATDDVEEVQFFHLLNKSHIYYPWFKKLNTVVPSYTTGLIQKHFNIV